MQEKQLQDKRNQQINGQMQNNPQNAESHNYCSPPTDFHDCKRTNAKRGNMATNKKFQQQVD